MEPDNLEDYKEQFSEGSFWTKLQKHAKKLGVKTVYTALLFFYAFKRKDTPRWAKNIIIGTLGYLLAPIDLIPDLTPLIGFTDDLGLLSFGLVGIAAFINDEVKEQSREHLKKWFGDYDDDQLKQVDEQL